MFTLPHIFEKYSNKNIPNCLKNTLPKIFQTVRGGGGGGHFQFFLINKILNDVKDNGIPQKTLENTGIFPKTFLRRMLIKFYLLPERLRCCVVV